MLQPVVLLARPKEGFYGIVMHRDYVRLEDTGIITEPETLAELRALVVVKYAEANRRTVPYDYTS